ncbi:MAG TPA: hypothetical protein VIT38_13450 [Allosphingosinicella sp.]|jgi:hypothetical protein
MKAFAKLIWVPAAFALIPAGALAQNPASGLPPVAPAAIIDAAQSCGNAVTTERLDEQRLAADGWTLGSVTNNGRAADTPLRFFSRNSIMLVTTPGEASCFVMARLESRQSFVAVRDGMTAAFGRPFRADASGMTQWILTESRAAQLDATGSREQPAVRISIIHMSGNNQ